MLEQFSTLHLHGSSEAQTLMPKQEDQSSRKRSRDLPSTPDQTKKRTFSTREALSHSPLSITAATNLPKETMIQRCLVNGKLKKLGEELATTLYNCYPQLTQRNCDFDEENKNPNFFSTAVTALFETEERLRIHGCNHTLKATSIQGQIAKVTAKIQSALRKRNSDEDKARLNEWLLMAKTQHNLYAKAVNHASPATKKHQRENHGITQPVKPYVITPRSTAKAIGLFHDSSPSRLLCTPSQPSQEDIAARNLLCQIAGKRPPRGPRQSLAKKALNFAVEAVTIESPPTPTVLTKFKSEPLPPLKPPVNPSPVLASQPDSGQPVEVSKFYLV